MDVNEEKSSITLDLPNAPNIFPSYHTSEVIPYIKNDVTLFPNREFSKPPAVTVEDATEEYFIHDIIDEWRCSCGYRYLVRWVGYGAEEDCWLKGADLKDTEALDIWLAKCKMKLNLVSSVLFLPGPAGSFPTGF